MAYQKKDPKDRIGHPHYAAVDTGPILYGKSRREEIPAIPEASEYWLPQARSWFNSLKLSGQSEWYEASDWATAICAAEAYDRFLRTQSPGILAGFVRLSERLGATVIDRKKCRIELDGPNHADVDEEAADKAVTNWQFRLGSKAKRHGLAPVPDPDPE